MSDLIASPADSATAVTMASFELVDFINSQRKESESELRHDHFMAKVPKVLGEEAAPKFRDSYIGRDGTTRPCYRFPKREACLMAMSYSYELQAKVFDRMTELEAKAKTPAPAAVANFDQELARLVGLRAANMISEAAAEVAAFHMMGLTPHPSMIEAMHRPAAAAPASARVRAQKPEPALPKPVKIGKVRGREHGPGISLALHEVSDHCGVPMDRLMHSMYTHGLLTEGGTPTKKGREFVQSTRLGRRYWKLGALLRYLA